MPHKYQLLDRVLSYVSKPDKTNTDPRFLVSPSQNVLISDQLKVITRPGYTILGAAGSGSDPIESSYDWQTSLDTVLNLRAYSDEMEVYAGTVEGIEFNTWERVLDGWTALPKSYASWWETTDDLDVLLMVNGTDKIWEWGGGITTYASSTANTLVKQTTTKATWATAGFRTTGTNKVRVKDTGGTWREFTYSGGEDGATLTITAGNPTSYTFAAGALCIQSVRENDNEPVDGAINDFIRVADNQLWVGSNSTNEVYVSKPTDFKDYSTNTPRQPGDGALLVFDSVGRGFLPGQGFMLISAGRSDWYKTSFEQITVSTTLCETIKVKKLKTSPGMAVQSQDLIDGDYFISFESVLRKIVGVDENDNLITEDLSDPIKPDFDVEDFTNGHLKIHRNRVYVACPENSTLWINEVRRNIDGTYTRFWNPPQILPLRRLAIIGDLIYGHSSGFNETYKLFDGTRDYMTPISFNASFAYRNYGDRTALKKFILWLTEGYIRGNTKITLQLRYEFQGSKWTPEAVIDGSDEIILFETIEGLTPLGTTPFGLQEESTQQPKFKIINKFAPRNFFEIQAVYYSSALDDQWEILAQGGNILISPAKPTHITK